MRFLICSNSTFGYLLPALEVAGQLREIGHDVAFATHMTKTAFLAKHNFQRLPRGEKDGQSFVTRLWPHPLEMVRQAQHVLHAAGQFQPDVIITSQLTFGVLIAAQKLSLPVAILEMSTFLWPTDTTYASPQDDYDRFKNWRFGMMLERYYQLAALFKTDVASFDDASTMHENPFLGDLSLLRSVPALEPAAADLPEKVTMIGMCMPPDTQPHNPELAQWLARRHTDRPLVFVQNHHSPIGAPDFWAYLAPVLETLDCDVVAAIPSETASCDASRFIAPHIPHGQIFPRASLIVSVGTSSLLTGAILHQVPLLLFPSVSEQPDVAARCNYAGIGVTLPLFNPMTHEIYEENLSAEQLTDAINRALHEPSIKARLKAVHTDFKTHKLAQPQQVARLLESYF